ncbi:MAG: hypothetical protein WAM60_00020, partial [Candidatus Promineifilaceae bacterium]
MSHKRCQIGLLLLGLIVLSLIVACGEKPPSFAPVTADCNPTPALEPSLSSHVESISYLGPDLYGPVHSLNVGGDMIYLGLGNTFAIMDASNSAEPRLVGTLPLIDPDIGLPFTDFSVHDGLAYLSWGGKNYTIDVSDPTQPREVVCTLAVPWPQAAKAFGGRYFISNSSLGGIQIEERPLDAALPTPVASYATYTTPKIEWQQPPDQLIPLPALTESEPMYVRRYTFDDRYLYLLNVIRIPGDYCCGSLTILDLENPAKPRHISTTELPPEYAPLNLAVAEDMLFISFFEPRGYNPHTYMYDISNRRKPKQVASIPGITLPYVHDGYAYFPGEQKIDIWDLHGEKGPRVVGRIEIPGMTDNVRAQWENRLTFVGDDIYFSAESALSVLNNEEPANPFLIEQMTFPLLPRSPRLTVSNGRLMSIMATPYQSNIQTWKPDEAGQKGEWQPLPGTTISGEFEDITTAGDWVYALDVDAVVGSTTTYLYGYNLNAASPVPTTTLTIPDFDGRKSAADFPYLYLLESTQEYSAIKVVDVSNPADPELVREVPLEPAYYQDLVVWEDSLYVVSTLFESALWHFDISDR